MIASAPPARLPPPRTSVGFRSSGGCCSHPRIKKNSPPFNRSDHSADQQPVCAGQSFDPIAPIQTTRKNVDHNRSIKPGAGRILQWRPYAGRPDHANASDNRCRVQHRTALGNVVAAMTHALQGTIPTWLLRSGVALAAEIESRCARFQHEQNPGAIGGKPNPASTRRQIFIRPCLHDPLKTPQHQPK